MLAHPIGKRSEKKEKINLQGCDGAPLGSGMWWCPLGQWDVMVPPWAVGCAKEWTD